MYIRVKSKISLDDHDSIISEKIPILSPHPILINIERF
jgi:hypothetical protein